MDFDFEVCGDDCALLVEGPVEECCVCVACPDDALVDAGFVGVVHAGFYVG